jgi:hypothetical protein
LDSITIRNTVILIKDFELLTRAGAANATVFETRARHERVTVDPLRFLVRLRDSHGDAGVVSIFEALLSETHQWNEPSGAL